jgi:signal transduction histidine kinase
MKIRVSIFTKLVLVIFATGIVINLLVAGFFRLYFHHDTRIDTRITFIKKSVRNYTDYLINEIGFPPDIARARDISNRTQFDISIKGPRMQWASSERIPDIKLIREKYHIENVQGDLFGFGEGAYIYVKKKNGYTFLFFRPRSPVKWGEGYLLALPLVLTVIFIAIYGIIRKILQPLKLLSRSVHEIAAGNLEHQAVVRSKDELGELTESFNDMKNALKDMLKSKERLLRDVSHELRSPLTRIKVAIEFIESDSLRMTIEEEVNEMEQMIAEILETERLAYLGGNPKTEDIDIEPLINEISNELNIRSAALRIANPGWPVILRGDRKWIKIVIRNVLDNAVKYSDADARPVDIAFSDSIDMQNVEIRDHGAGIEAMNIPYVFEPFYRADDSRSRKTGGYGLGLSICKKIIEAHGGAIDIKSKVGEGTSIILKFRK